MTIIPFTNTTFWLITALFILIYIIFHKIFTSIQAKNCYMTGVSLAVISLSINHASTLIPLLFFLLLFVFFTGKYLLESNRDKTKYILSTAILLPIIFLIYFKYSIIQSSANRLAMDFIPDLKSSPNSQIFFIGVSYFTFKFIHFLIECNNGKIKNLDILTFINYTVFFPSFFSGPINRYNSFSSSILKDIDFTDNLLTGTKRIINGLFKKIVLGDFFFPYSIAALNLKASSPTDILLGAYAYGFYIYFNFAGYTDMAIGCGKMVGIELPENFNYPFLKRNLQKFWSNWHMSLTSWLTDYIYWPLVKKLRHNKTLKKKSVTLSNISIVITFIICGVWHGDGLNFFLWGLYHGIGLAILNGYTYFIKRHTGKKIKQFVHKSPIAYGISTMITFQYVVFGFFLFACNMDQLKTISTILF